MKVSYLIALSTALSFSAGAFAADDGETLFKKSGCNVCHSVDKKVLGPAYKDVAAKYKDNKDAQAMLEAKVRNGGGGVWGKVPMPPAPKTVSDESIKIIIQWVLSQK